MLKRHGGTFDISRPIENGMIVWPGDTPVEVKTTKLLDNSRLTTLRLSAHTGTHVDAPVHFFRDGIGIDKLDLDILIGPARVLQISEAGCINRHTLEEYSFQGETRLLLGTINSKISNLAFKKDYVSLTEDAAEYIVQCGVRLLAVDCLSVDCFESITYPVHHMLLNAGVIIVEGVFLKDVAAGKYELLCLPLKLIDSDGAPARVVLREV
jgi:arylformamidase